MVLKLPKRGVEHEDERSAPGFPIEKIWYCNLLEVIKSMFHDPTASKFHWIPHLLLHKCATPSDPDVSPERLIMDVYNSNTMICTHDKIQQLPHNPDDTPNVEYIVAGIGIYLDLTCLMNFGNVSLWPIYGYILNLLKYLCLKPTMFATHHLAYIPSVHLCS